MQIIRDHLIVPDTGRAKLSSNSQRQPSNTLCPYPSGHPHTASLFFATSPRPPTQTLNPWRRPQANGEQGAPEWALDWPLSGPTAESLLFTQSLTLYVFLSLNCIGLCCPLVNQYHLSNDISNTIQQGLSR